METNARHLEVIAVAICDHQPVFAKGLASLLEAEAPKCRVSAVTTSPIELDAVIGEEHPDVILLDATFGVNAITGIRDTDPDASVILMGSHESQVDLPEALGAGARAYVSKHDDVTEICDVIHMVLRGYSIAPSSLLLKSLRLTSSMHQLNETERRILSLLAYGATNQDIARNLHLSERTVRRYLIRIYSKLHVADRIQAALYAVQSGLVTLETASERPGSETDSVLGR